MENYFILNRETGKLELHFEKETYSALDESKKNNIKSHFVWGRRSGCWISRAKEPHLYFAQKAAEAIGLQNAGAEGERLTFAEQMERKAEKAERRANIYDHRSAAAEERAEQLQKPINDMHGDIAFFTQPNINTCAGRAFTRRRDRMFAAYDQGFAEFRKSEYWQDRAKTARATASQKELQDKGFIGRRIAEREKDIRAYRKNIECIEKYLDDIEKTGAAHDEFGREIKSTPEQLQERLEYWLDRMEVKLDELGYYQDAMEALGGVQFSKENVKPGDLVRVRRYSRDWVSVISTGPKNIRVDHLIGSAHFYLQYAYAEILEVKPAEPIKQPDASPEAVQLVFPGFEICNA